MGLEWFPDNRARPGHEAEFAQLISLDASELDVGVRARAKARYRAISESPYDFARAEGHTRKLAFRAERLREAVGVIGEPLLDRAWERQTAQELAAYGGQLQAAARSFARKHGLDWDELNEISAPAGSDGADERAAAFRITVEAARWCLWWSAIGFGLDPDY